MRAIPLTKQLALAAAQDTANRRMHREGRKVWNREDFDAACDEYERLMTMAHGWGGERDKLKRAV